MKQKSWMMVVLLVICVLVPGRVCFALRSSGNPGTAIGMGAHYHVALSQLEGTEFDDNYLSYLVGLKFKSNNQWTIDAVLEYYPSGEDISHIISPRLSFLYGSGFYFGTGTEWRYVKLESGESNWNDQTYFVQAGFEMPLGGDNALNLDAYYGLESLSDVSDVITDFDSDHLTFGIGFYHYF